MEDEKTEVIEKPRFDVIDKVLTLITIMYGFMYFIPFFVPMFSYDLALVAILSEIKPDPQFFNIWLILVGALTGKKVSDIRNK